MSKHFRGGGGGIHRGGSDRTYRFPKEVNDLDEVRDLAKRIQRDNIPKNLKRQRLQFLHSLTFTEAWKANLGKSDSLKAQKLTKAAYQPYLKGK